MIEEVEMKKKIINIQIAVFTLITAILILFLPIAAAKWESGGSKTSEKNNGLHMISEIFNGSVFGQSADKSILLRIGLVLCIAITLILLLVHIITAIISVFGRQKRLMGILFSVIPLVTFIGGFFLYKISAASCLDKALGDGSDASVGFGIGLIIAAVMLLVIAIEEIVVVRLLVPSDRRKTEPADYGYGYGDPGAGGAPSDYAGPDSAYMDSDYPAYGSPEPGYPNSDYMGKDYSGPGYGDGYYGGSYPDSSPNPSHSGGDGGYASGAYNGMPADSGYGSPAGAEQSIRCLSGEYEGAVLPLRPGDTMYIGRDRNICNVILNNPRVSRKHCSIQYDISTDSFKVVNYSKNGIFIDGQRLELNRPYQLPHGTILKISDADMFHLL